MGRNRELLTPVESESEEDESEANNLLQPVRRKFQSAKPPSPPPPSEAAQNSSSRARSKPIAPAKSDSAKRLAEDRDARVPKKSKITEISKEKSELFRRLWSESMIDCPSSQKAEDRVIGAGRKLFESGRGREWEEEWRKLRIEELELYIETLKLRQARTQLLLDFCNQYQ